MINGADQPNVKAMFMSALRIQEICHILGKLQLTGQVYRSWCAEYTGLTYDRNLSAPCSMLMTAESVDLVTTYSLYHTFL